MATNQYFNNQNNTAQQDLAEQLIIQAIQHRGIDVKYIPEETVLDEELFNESLVTKFSQVADIEMYVENITNFNGQGDVWGSFGGFSMEDNATLVVSQKRFREVMNASTKQLEPKTGDLIYIPYANLTFEIDKILEDDDFRQWGQNYVYRIRMTKWSYGHEDMDTGISELDDLENYGESINIDGDLVVVPEKDDEMSVNRDIQDEFSGVELNFGDK
ncbi:neck protein [Vibrio phage 1.244.A._10N.261.54.C3]|nr:neck protein [Vibrio phage 1.244.A._10N.261.54.C3]AUR98838.1 neck protein [Vibrio phage 1.255.O._10N.286.45.F1]